MTDDPTLTSARTAEHERALLAAVLLDPNIERCRATLAATAPSWFGDPARAATWAQTRRVMATEPPPPAGPERVKAVHAESAGDPHSLSFAALADVTDKAPGVGTADYYAARVFEAHLQRAVLRGWLDLNDDAERERIANLSAADLIAERLDYFRRLGALLPGADQLRRAVPVTEISGDRPERLMHCAGRKGALLSIGGVLVLAGEGGIAKTPLALSIAAGMAARPDGTYGPLHGGLFEGVGAPVLIAGYEDAPSVSADRLRKLAAVWWPTGDAPALRRLHILNMAGRALFGPAAGDLYAARPGPLPGWAELWDEVKRIGARLVVIDPALSAYVGDANSAAPVRDFMGVLAEAAEVARCGVLIVAHSRKDARGRNNRPPDPFDPGNVAGSTHWTDAARGALTLTWDSDAEAGARVLAVAKANYGPSHILASVDPVRSPHGEIVGFTGGPWQTLAEREGQLPE
ncbi:MAG: AAA family ATPase [Spirochaetaceae bacterium]|nr:AAA family ATPase [Spirochaetaceae bacterium]MDE2768574.1 AAA family ATPase [Chloroflexota bacterium]